MRLLVLVVLMLSNGCHNDARSAVPVTMPAAVATPLSQAPAPAPTLEPPESVQPLLAPTTPVTIADKRLVASTLNRFSVRLLQALPHTDTNQLLAPPGVAIALSMYGAGAPELVQKELQQALSITLPPAHWHQALSALQVEWNKHRSKAATLISANALFGNQSLAFRSRYLAGLDTLYRSKLTLVDFANPEEAAAKVNRWISEQTRGRIRNAVASEQFEPTPAPVAVVLANALYFKARWLSEFSPEVTVKRPFWNRGIEAVRQPTMELEESFAFKRTPTYAAIELPYRQTLDGHEPGRFAMMVILPNERRGLAEVMAECLARELDACVTNMRSTYVRLRLPKFTLDLPPLDLAMPLQALGLVSLFQTNGLSMPGMLEDSVPVALRGLRQQSYIAVDEQGTEAAAATFGIGGIGDLPPEPVPFYVDHPFLFFIRDRVSGAVLFVGRVQELAGAAPKR